MASPLLLIACCVLVFAGVIWAGISLDRLSQRRQSESWMRSWVIRTRVLRELYDRWHGPLRLQDRRAAPAERQQDGRRERSKEG